MKIKILKQYEIFFIFCLTTPDSAQAMITATGITVPALISFIAFNMTTIPCFAAVGTAKAELGGKESYKGTLIFWLISSYCVGAMVYTLGSWWWTLFIWLVVATVAVLSIILWNKRGGSWRKNLWARGK